MREAAKRTLGMRHFDVQLMGGAALHQGNNAEMKTGEGKTLVSTLPSYLNALAGNGVHVVSVNDYLIKRDSAWMGQVHHSLGLEVGMVVADVDDHASAALLDQLGIGDQFADAERHQERHFTQIHNDASRGRGREFCERRRNSVNACNVQATRQTDVAHRFVGVFE